MVKQRKQMAVLLLILFAACGVLGFVSLSSKEEAEAMAEEGFVVNDIEADEATKLIFTNSTGTYSLRKEEEKWILEEDKTAEVDETEVTRLLAAVAPLRSADRIEQAEDLSLYGLDSPVRTIMVSNSEKNSTILVGDFNEITDTYYICLEEDTSTVYTAEYDTVSAFEVQTEDLIIEPDEEETTEEAE
ncbi:MAG: DUF4340 domain-containing protein [Lachnospiraceae bacterium]|nr:DUF4340 domain-containing protein [Lachnospiraceae bacterium]